MTIKISHDIMEQLILKTAENIIGPATYQYLQILKDNKSIMNSDLVFLASLFTTYHPDQIEEIFFMAVERGVNNICHLPPLIEEIEKEEFQKE